MNRRQLLQAASLLALHPLSAKAAAQSSAEKHVMLLLYRGETEAERGFRDYLQSKLSVRFTVLDAANDKTRIAAMVSQAKQTKPDLIYTFGTSVTLGTVGAYNNQQSSVHIADIPVVFNIVADPVGAGLAPDTQSSLRNLTGVSHLAPPEAQWQALQRFATPKRLAILYSANEKNAVLAAARMARQTQDAGVETLKSEIAIDADGKPSKTGLIATLAKLLAQKPDWIYLPSDSFLIANADTVVAAANAASVAAFAATEEPVRESGALAGLVSPYYAAGQFAGFKAEQILSGKAKPAQLPLDTLARFTYLVNIASAQRLHRYPPLSLLRYAEMIEANAAS